MTMFTNFFLAISYFDKKNLTRKKNNFETKKVFMLTFSSCMKRNKMGMEC